MQNPKTIPPKHSPSDLNTNHPSSINPDLNTHPLHDIDLGRNIQSIVDLNLEHSSHALMQNDNMDIGINLGLNVPQDEPITQHDGQDHAMAI